MYNFKQLFCTKKSVLYVSTIKSNNDVIQFKTKKIDTKNSIHIIKDIFDFKYVFINFAAPKQRLNYTLHFEKPTHTHPLIITDGWKQSAPITRNSLISMPLSSTLIIVGENIIATIKKRNNFCYPL